MKTQITLLFILCSFINDAVSKSFRHEIPFQYEEDQRYILIEVEINGSKEKRNFFFDTGGANILNLSRYDFTQDKKSVRLQTLKIGDFVLENKKFKVHDWGKFQSKFMNTMDGMVGRDLMKNYAWMIDYQEKKIIVSNDVQQLLYGSTPRFVMSFKNNFIDASPVLKLKINDEVTIHCTVDTGSPEIFGAFDKMFITSLKDKEGIKYTTDSVTVISYMTNGEKIKVPNYIVELEDGQLGNLHLKNYTVEFSRHGYNLIGNKFLENFTIILDWPGKLIYLDPAENSGFSFEGNSVFVPNSLK